MVKASVAVPYIHTVGHMGYVVGQCCSSSHELVVKYSILCDCFYLLLHIEVGVEVQFRLPATYPDEVPEVTIVTGTGLEAGEMREMERNISQQVSTL